MVMDLHTRAASSKVKARAAALVVVAGLYPITVLAVEQPKLTLACEGTTTDKTQPDGKPEPISMGIVVNFTAQTVEGFGYPGLDDFPVKIRGISDVTIAFAGSSTSSALTINGSIDRVTGAVEATAAIQSPKTGLVQSSMEYLLRCRPSQRMF